MNSLNSILLEGNLTRDPEFKTTNNGASLCKFSIAVNRYYKVGSGDKVETKEEVSFFDIVTWGKLAERCNEYLMKGRGVRAVGRIKQDRWADKDGKQRSRVVIVADHVEFKPKPTGSQQPPTGNPGPGAGPPVDGFEDDIPF